MSLLKLIPIFLLLVACVKKSTQELLLGDDTIDVQMHSETVNELKRK